MDRKLRCHRSRRGWHHKVCASPTRFFFPAPLDFVANKLCGSNAPRSPSVTRLRQKAANRPQKKRSKSTTRRAAGFGSLKSNDRWGGTQRARRMGRNDSIGSLGEIRLTGHQFVIVLTFFCGVGDGQRVICRIGPART